jgi:hypothetical protein
METTPTAGLESVFSSLYDPCLLLELANKVLFYE